MTEFPTLLYTSTSEIPTLSSPEAWKRYPFRAEPPRIGHYIYSREYPPPGIITNFSQQTTQGREYTDVTTTLSYMESVPIWSVRIWEHSRHKLFLTQGVNGSTLRFPSYLHQAEATKVYGTRIAERQFLTGLPRGYFFWGKGAAIHTQATIKPCRRPLRETESHVRRKHKLIQNIVPFWKTFVTKKLVPFFGGGCIITFKFHYYE